MSGLLLVVAAFGCADNTYKTTVATNVFEVSPSYIGADQGTPIQLDATVDGDPVAVTWESSDIAKATVSSTGLVTTLAPGFVAVTATQTANTAKKKSASLTIYEVFGTAIALGTPVNVGTTTTGQSTLYRVYVPPAKTNLSVVLAGGTGDHDIFVRKASPPDNSGGNDDCHSWNGGNGESCQLADPGSGTWYVLVDAYAGGAGAVLTVSVTP